MTGKEILQKLSELPHRGATSSKEREAADLLKNTLDNSGIESSLDRFKATPTYSWEIVLFAATMMAGILISYRLSFLGTAIVLLGFWSFIRHFFGKSTIFTTLIPKHFSQNVIGKIPSKSGNSDHNLILMAHYDTARASLLFSPKMVNSFRRNFVFNTVVSAAAIPWAFSGQYFGVYWWYKLVCILFAINFLTNILIHIHREIAHKFVQGINDNGSGIAAIIDILNKLKDEPLINTNVWIVFTGCEETVIQGARDFLDRHKYELNPEKTSLINLDNIGQGNLHYVTGEGMLLFWHYNDILINKCAAIASQRNFSTVSPLEYRLAYFDSLVFAQQGYPCTTLIALDDQDQIPNWHWYTDTIDNIDWETISLAVDFAIELARQIDLA